MTRLRVGGAATAAAAYPDAAAAAAAYPDGAAAAAAYPDGAAAADPHAATAIPSRRQRLDRGGRLPLEVWVGAHEFLGYAKAQLTLAAVARAPNQALAMADFVDLTKIQVPWQHSRNTVRMKMFWRFFCAVVRGRRFKRVNLRSCRGKVDMLLGVLCQHMVKHGGVVDVTASPDVTLQGVLALKCGVSDVTVLTDGCWQVLEPGCYDAESHTVALALLGAVHRLRNYLSESERVVYMCSTHHTRVAETMAQMHTQYGSGMHPTATEPDDRHMMSRWLLRLFGPHLPVSLVHFNQYTVWHRGDPRRLVVRVLYRGDSLRRGRYCDRNRRTRESWAHLDVRCECDDETRPGVWFVCGVHPIPRDEVGDKKTWTHVVTREVPLCSTRYSPRDMHIQ